MEFGVSHKNILRFGSELALMRIYGGMECALGDFYSAACVAVGEDAPLIDEDGVDVAGELWAGAVEVSCAAVPDFGDELGVDDSFDVGLPDVPDAFVEDAEVY